MFRITVTLKPGHDMESIVFTIRADNVALALQSAIRALAQLGFKANDYDLAHSQRI